MLKKIENLSWKPMWVSHIGSIKGCVDYLGLGISDAWLFGGTGHAFVMNMADDMCLSGPTAWNTGRLFELGRNLGYEIEGFQCHKTQPEINDVRAKAWELVKQSLDRGNPCYGWELAIPEYYVINGYDDVGYYYSGPVIEQGKMPLPWQKVAETEIGWLVMWAVKRRKPADDLKTVKDALAFALDHASTRKWMVNDRYHSGPAGFDVWAHALESGKLTEPVNGRGMAYNAEVWAECRAHAVGFLKEAKTRLANRKLDSLFDEAITHYSAVAGQLAIVRGLFPFLEFNPAHIKDADRRAKAVAALKAARDAEVKGLEFIARVVGAL